MSTVSQEYLTPDSDQNADDRKLSVRFHVEAVLDTTKSAEEGREVYRDVEMVTILNPGDKLLTFKEKVQPKHKFRFPQHYAAFKAANGGDVVVGTPLSRLPGVSPGQIKEMEYLNIRTVENLAEVSDGSTAASIMGVVALKAAAKRYLEDARANAPLTKLQAEREAMTAQMEAQNAQIADLASKLEALTKKSAK